MMMQRVKRLTMTRRNPPLAFAGRRPADFHDGPCSSWALPTVRKRGRSRTDDFLCERDQADSPAPTPRHARPPLQRRRVSEAVASHEQGGKDAGASTSTAESMAESAAPATQADISAAVAAAKAEAAAALAAALAAAKQELKAAVRAAVAQAKAEAAAECDAAVAAAVAAAKAEAAAECDAAVAAAIKQRQQPSTSGHGRKLRTCAISHLPLLDPARGEACVHPALCNFDELRQFAARAKVCPIAGCSAKISRMGNVVRDARSESMLGEEAEPISVD